MDCNKTDPKSLFNLKRSRFEVKSYTVDSLLAERNQLYDKLQALTDESDSYARYITKLNNEKNLIAHDLSEFKLTCELLTLQQNRLENQNKILREECCGLLDLVSKIGPSELYNLDSGGSVTAESVINKIKDSIKVLCDDRKNLVCTKDSLHEELSLVKSSLTNANETICRLNKEINDLNNKIVDNERQERSRRNSMQCMALPSSSNVSNVCSIGKCSSVPDIGDIREIVKNKRSLSISLAFDDSNLLSRVKSDSGVLKLSNLELCKLKESLSVIAKSVKSLMDHTSDTEGFDLRELSVDMDTISSASDIGNVIEKYRVYICNSLDNVKGYICALNSKRNNLQDENNMLNSELKMLKYALTCRIELKKHQSNSRQKIDKNAEINRLNNEIEALKNQINELEEDIETVRREKRSLLALLDSITAT